MKQNIQIKQWLELKPYNKFKKTDSYYLKLSNKIHHATSTNSHTMVLRNYLPKREIEMLACFLTSYFEDIISNTNIWNAFVNAHQRLYKKFLPFYPTELYKQNSINLQDVCFLMWYFINSTQDEIFKSPSSEFIIEISSDICDIFIESKIYAPTNKDLKPYYHLDSDETDYYATRKLIDTILFKTYLFYPDTALNFRQEEAEMIAKHQNDENLMMYLNDFRDNSLQKECTQLLSFNGKQWLAEIIGEKHPLYQEVLSISKKTNGFFLYKGQDKDVIHIEHIASGKNFELAKISFDNFNESEVIDDILYMGIVQWKNQWWFSGIFFQQAYNTDMITKEKENIQSRINVSFLDHSTKKSKETITLHYKTFKKFNNNESIAFLPSEKLNDFYEKFIVYFNASLNSSAQGKKEAKQRAKKAGLSNSIKNKIDFRELTKSGLVFFNPKAGVEIVLNSNSAFPLPSNPYFDAEQSEEHIMQLITDTSISTELVNHCIDNCQSSLPFFDSDTGQYILKDLDFLLRFWKKEKYHTVPSVSFVH